MRRLPRPEPPHETTTECERVERAFGGERLLDDDPPDDPPMLGRGALGGKVFVHPDPDDLAGAVKRIAAGEPTDDDRARFVGAAAGAVPGTTEVDGDRARAYRERASAADSWVGRAIDAWEQNASAAGEPVADDVVAREETRGAPPTRAW